MATAKQKARTAPALEFLVSEDNGNGYHWTIVSDGGELLAQSVTFASYDDAQDAADRVHEGAGSAKFEHGTGDKPQLVAV